MGVTIRKPAVAGYFYPADPKRLSAMVDRFLSHVKGLDVNKGKLRAIIVPHAGYAYSGEVAAYGYALLRKLCSQNVNKVIMLGPPHTCYLNDAVADVHDYWETPLGRVPVTRDGFPGMEGPHCNEHSLEVQLPFLQKILGEFRILPLLIGHVDIEEVSLSIRKLLDEQTILIASSDLSHFYDYDTACLLDQKTNRAIETLDVEQFDREGIACGKIPIEVVMDIACKLGWRCRLLCYRNSGDTAGDKKKVVGYGSFAFFE